MSIDPIRPPAEALRAHLAPYLGPFTAKNAVQMVAKQTLGVDADLVRMPDVPRLLEALGPTLRMLLGRDGAEKLVAKIRKEMHLG